ncbi:ankyrin repeat-containing protein NPR4-like [Vitis riparia]|uniref:ankyrin repeat-containing protein NPR4-like n=1 Tax=Vitis riparia TaxID=96939 RepID=UPI00155AE798|nr:ankyrin repeat-containing protein NPR4-like [Vitis riparia]
MNCERLTQLLVEVDTSWDASGDDQNPVERASELSQRQEGKIPQGSTSTSEYNKSVENPLLLATISNIQEIVKAILNCQPQVLEHTNKKCEENPLFLAIISNIPNIVRKILTFHPQAIELTNKEGMNILHVAILYRHTQIFDMVVEEFEVLSRRLLSARDDKGNSLLHMVGQKRKSQVSEKMQSPALQLRQELLLFEKVKKACQLHVTKPLNKENKTAEELFVTRNEKLHREAKEWLMRTTENCTLLSVFIATVAFAAAYTVPGVQEVLIKIPVFQSLTANPSLWFSL